MGRETPLLSNEPQAAISADSGMPGLKSSSEHHQYAF
jgi:hypothetical protein